MPVHNRATIRDAASEECRAHCRYIMRQYIAGKLPADDNRKPGRAVPADVLESIRRADKRYRLLLEQLDKEGL